MQFQNITGVPTYGVSITVREVVTFSSECISELKELRKQKKIIDRIVANYRVRKAKEEKEKLERSNRILNNKVVKTIRRNSMLHMRFNPMTDGDTANRRHSDDIAKKPIKFSDSFRIDKSLNSTNRRMVMHGDTRPRSEIDMSRSERDKNLLEMMNNRTFEFTPIDDLMDDRKTTQLYNYNAKGGKNTRHMDAKYRLSKNERKASIMQFLLQTSNGIAQNHG